MFNFASLYVKLQQFITISSKKEIEMGKEDILKLIFSLNEVTFYPKIRKKQFDGALSIGFRRL